MESSILPELLVSPDLGPLPLPQDSAPDCPIENPTPQDVIENTNLNPVNEDAADQALDHGENKSSAEEASIPRTTASQVTTEKTPADENVPPIFWCRVELNDPTHWSKFVVLPGGRQGLRPVGVPPLGTGTAKHGTPHETGAVQSRSPEIPLVKYSNKFLGRGNRIVTIHPWPEALDLDQERGKPAGSKAGHHKPIIELVTIVRTNIEINPYTQDLHRDTRAILSDPRVTAEFVGKEVAIDSVRIVDAFKAMITYYPGLELRGITMTIPEPFCVFYHYYEELKALRETQNHSTESPNENKHTENTTTGHETHNSETVEHLKILCDFIEGQNLKDVELERKRHLQNPPVATYRMMWLLFKPGTRIYNFSSGRATAGVVISAQTDSGSQRPGLRSLKFWTLDFDGFKLGRRELSHNFRPFDGEKMVSELPVSPCDLYDAQDNNRLRDELIHRGKMFWKFLPGAQVDYDGKLPNEAIEWVSPLLSLDPSTREILLCDTE